MNKGVILYKYYIRLLVLLDYFVEYINIRVSRVFITFRLFITGYYNYVRTPFNLNSTLYYNTYIITILISLYKLRILLLRYYTLGLFALTFVALFDA
jgi:hypothetical protein